MMPSDNFSDRFTDYDKKLSPNQVCSKKKMVGRRRFELLIPWSLASEQTVRKTQTRNHSQARPPTLAVVSAADCRYKNISESHQLVSCSVMNNLLTYDSNLIVSTMSLLGPDDFDLDGKSRKKKLAKDLSPAVAKEIERWLDREQDPEAIRRVSELVGPEEAARLFAKKHRKLKPENPLLEE